MEQPRAAIALPLAVGIALVGWFALKSRDGAPSSKSEPSESEVGGHRGEASAPVAIADTASPPLDSSTHGGDEADEDDEAGEQDRRDKRDLMRALIWKAFGMPVPVTPPTAAARYVLPDAVPPPPGVQEKLEPKYIQSHVRDEFFPVARDCYSDALKISPDLAGEIDLFFTIVGNKNIGGIVESVDVLNKSTLRDPAMIECIRESFLATTFPPPDSGGYVTVEYPILFSPDDDEGGGE